MFEDRGLREEVGGVVDIDLGFPPFPYPPTSAPGASNLQKQTTEAVHPFQGWEFLVTQR